MKVIKNSLFIFIALTLIVSCSKEKENNFILKGSIKDLKKGVVYLQKDGDSSVIDLDSVVIKGQPEFLLSTTIEEPILLYLKLEKNDGQEHFIPFFADEGETQIKTTLKSFNTSAEINGAEQQKVLEGYLTLMDDFKNKNLDLIKANYEALKRKDSIASDSIVKQSERLLRLKYASTINFALNNNDSEVAPYLALYEIPDTSIKYLDSIYNNLTDRIKTSHYGKILEKSISDFKTELK
ncbi:MAG: DUF4369 domain-containing protein [Winogradskyella sp.]|uniref:DUF4369 domain-containing protein n=1 Tax=Winogradskyella sp. TaxID=1883156 RepID=UPI000F4067C0|nr:DUF4369 domain-containing protein [Winogradskyella sp.]RNC84944.1 MAG: DUF4369 domain-containing protein [Winogradskyella sp.]